MSIDYTNRDYEGFRNYMISTLQEKIPEYTDTSETDAGIVLIEALAKGLDVLSYVVDEQANENFLITAERRDNILDRCYELAYIPKSATPSYFKQVFVLSAQIDGIFTIPKGTVIKTKETPTENPVYFETVEDLHIPLGKWGNEKDIYDNYLYTVDIVQGTTVDGELLGTSDGTVSQKFNIDYSPVLPDTVSIVVNEGFGYEQWEKVDTFIDSDSTSKHFKVTENDDSTSTITFGDGVFGKIPNTFTNGIFAYYRIGGGIQGNVSSNTITVLEESIGEVAETFNPEEAYVRGTNRESVDSIKVNAPNHNRTKWGAITLKDHTDLVKEYFSVHIKYVTSMQDETNIDKVNIYVLPVVGTTASTEMKNEIANFFSMDRQFVGGEVDVLDPVFVDLSVTGTIYVDSEYVALEVKQEVDDYIRDYFAIGNYDFNSPLYVGDLESEIKNNIPGIKTFRISLPTQTVYPAEQNEIIKLNVLTLSTVGGITL